MKIFLGDHTAGCEKFSFILVFSPNTSSVCAAVTGCVTASGMTSWSRGFGVLNGGTAVKKFDFCCS